MVRSTRGLRGVAALVALLFVCGPRRDVRAGDDPDKRRELMRQIDGKVDDLVDELEDVAGDSSERSIDDARALAYEVKRLAEQLEDVAGDDSDAKRIADRYPDDMDELANDAVPRLRALKQGQHHADPEAQMCGERDKELVRQAAEFESKNNPDGLTELPKLASQYQESTKQAMEQARRDDDKLEDASEDVDDYSADGGLRDVDSGVSAAGRRMYADGHKSEEAAERACENLLRGVDHPQVKEALAKLGTSAGGRKAIIEELDKQLAALTAALGGVAADSAVGSLDRASAAVTELGRGVETLGRTATTDPTTKVIVDKWPELVKQANEALAQLRVLKEAQRLADKAPEKCKETDQRLDELIKGYLDRRDPKGVREIPLRARGFAEPIKAGLEKTDEKHREMERAFGEADRYAPGDARWSGVQSAYRAAAREVYDYWKKARDAAHASCDELAKGDEHKDVKRAVDDLSRKRSDNANELDRVKADHRKWYEDLSELRQWWKTDTKAMRESFCSADESPGDAEWREYGAVVDGIADRMRDRIGSRWDELKARANALESRLVILETSGDDEVKEPAEKLRAELKKTVESVENFLRGEALGASNPRIRARMELGKNEHKRIQADSSKCTEDELTFGSTRVDCVRVDGNTCYVVEIKPNNEAARSKGNRQIRDGIDAIRSALSGKKKRVELTGNLEVLRPCFDEQKEEADLKPELRVYEYCPPEGELFHDFVVP